MKNALVGTEKNHFNNKTKIILKMSVGNQQTRPWDQKKARTELAEILPKELSKKGWFESKGILDDLRP